MRLLLEYFNHNAIVIYIRDDSNSASAKRYSLPMEQYTILPKEISSRQKNTDLDLLYVTRFRSSSNRYETGIGDIESIFTIAYLSFTSHLCMNKFYIYFTIDC